jgi:hypothetical protein
MQAHNAEHLARSHARSALASGALVTRFSRGTFEPKPETLRGFGRGSVQISAREIGDLASHFASLQFF